MAKKKIKSQDYSTNKGAGGMIIQLLICFLARQVFEEPWGSQVVIDTDWRRWDGNNHTPTETQGHSRIIVAMIDMERNKFRQGVESGWRRLNMQPVGSIADSLMMHTACINIVEP